MTQIVVCTCQITDAIVKVRDTWPRQSAVEEELKQERQDRELELEQERRELEQEKQKFEQQESSKISLGRSSNVDLKLDLSELETVAYTPGNDGGDTNNGSKTGKCNGQQSELTPRTPTNVKLPPISSPRTPKRRSGVTQFSAISPRLTTLLARSPRSDEFFLPKCQETDGPRWSTNSGGGESANPVIEKRLPVVDKRINHQNQLQHSVEKFGSVIDCEWTESARSAGDCDLDNQINQSNQSPLSLDTESIDESYELLETPKKNGAMERTLEAIWKTKPSKRFLELWDRYQTKSPRSPTFPEGKSLFALPVQWNIDQSFSPSKCAEQEINKPLADHLNQSIATGTADDGTLDVADKGTLSTDEARSREQIKIPKFYFPVGQQTAAVGTGDDDALTKVQEIFSKNNNMVNFDQMVDVCRAANLPIYWTKPLYESVLISSCSEKALSIGFDHFLKWWQRFTRNAHDEAARFVHILSIGRHKFIVWDDLDALIQGLIDMHPSLEPLHQCQPFQQAYIDSVKCRIFWSIRHSWNGRITINDLRQSNLLQVIRSLETSCVNSEHKFFSYEHFYVIFCKFTTLLTSADASLVYIDDFTQFANGALTDIVVKRIFSGVVSRHEYKNRRESSTISFIEFVDFLLAEVDKNHPTSIEYWFRIMDLDGDGRLTFCELEYFYQQIAQKLGQAELETIPFVDTINLLRDILKPKSDIYFTLSDLKRSPKAGFFINTFTNWIKHSIQEVDLPSVKNEDSEQISDWSLYCRIEYELIVTNNDCIEDSQALLTSDESSSIDETEQDARHSPQEIIEKPSE